MQFIFPFLKGKNIKIQVQQANAQLFHGFIDTAGKELSWIPRKDCFWGNHDIAQGISNIWYF
jgi:hypothetical protein